MARIPESVIENEALSLRARFNLGDKLPVDIDSLILESGIIAVYTKMSEAFSGMCLKYTDQTNFILINSVMPLGRQNYTVAHELYHLFVQDPTTLKVHSCDINSPESPIERRANSFASYFLMPTAGVLEMMEKLECNQKTINPAQIITMCDYFGVSYQAMLVRVNKILHLPNEQVEKLKAITPVKYACKYRLKREVFLIPERDNVIVGDYVSKAHTLYNSGKISKGHLIELLSALQFEEDGKD